MKTLENSDNSVDKFVNGIFIVMILVLVPLSSFMIADMAINHQNYSLDQWIICIVLTATMTGYVFLCGASLILINPEREEWAVSRLKKIMAYLTNPFKKQHPHNLPRTWGREWLLIRDKEIQKKLTAYDPKFFPLYLLIVLGSLASGILSLIRLDVTEGIIFASIFAFFFIIPMYIFSWSLKCISRDVLRPFYFYRLAKKTSGDRDSKMEAFKNTIPEAKYRVASFPPLNDAKQIRALLDAGRPLSRKQLSEAEAVIEAQAKAEEAETYAKLAQAQIQANSEAS